MATILVYGNRKQDDVAWDISTPEARKEGFVALFNYLKDEWQVYSADYWGGTSQEKTQKELYRLALEGDGEAAEKLLKMRQRYEYEEWNILETKARKKT